MRVYLIAQTQIVNNIPGYIPHTYAIEGVSNSDADILGEQAGRLCYLAWERLNPKTADNRGYIKNILDQGHYSVLEHSSVTFYIEGVTRAFLLELERHRHMSYSVVSQRYVDGDEFELIMHPNLLKLSDATRKRIRAHDAESHKLYRDIVGELGELGDGRKAARGAARTVLPEGTETRILVTGNLRAWMEVLWKRISASADLEICDVSKLILGELMQIAPNTYQNFLALES